MDRIEHTHFLATFFSLLLLISVVSTGFAPGVGASPDPDNTINADEPSALSGKTLSQTEDIDAEIVDITHDSGVHKDGDPVRVTVTVENTGSEANRFYIGFSVRDPSGDWLEGDNEASLYLRPGDKSTTDVIWYVDDNAESGMYDSRVSAWEESDPDNLQNRVADNQKSDAFEVETESKKYQLTADANGDGGFEVYPPGLSTTSVDREYEEGTTVELTATPGPDSQFVDWTGDVDSIDEDDATIEVTMNEAYDITANFEKESQEYRLEADPNGNGGFEVYPPGLSTKSVDRTYEEDTTVELTATPDSDSRFVEWTGDVGSADEDDATIEVTMDEDRDITAEFEEETEVSAEIEDVDPPSGDYTAGEEIVTETTIRNTGNTEHEFYVGYSVRGPDDEWRDNDRSTHESVWVEPGEEETIDVEWEVEDDAPTGEYDIWTSVYRDADGDQLEDRLDESRMMDVFEVETETEEYRLNADTDGEGGLEVDPPGFSTTSVDRNYEEGTKVELTAKSGPDSRFVGWNGDVGFADEDDRTIEVTMDEARDITAEFEEASQEYRLEADSDGNGGFELYPPGLSTTSVDRTYEEGTTVELTATPDSDSQFVEWSGDIGSADRDDATIEVSMNEARDITATFEEVSQDYRLEVDSNGEGGFEVYPPGFSATSIDREYEEGTAVELTATPGPDSRFVEWTGDIGFADENDRTIEVTMDEARDITAEFKEETKEYRLNADTDGEGGFEVNPPGFSTTSVDREYEEGTTVELTATPRPDSRFIEWTGDIGSADSDESTIEVTMSEARDITAVFEPTESTEIDAEIVDVSYDSGVHRAGDPVRTTVTLKNTGSEANRFYIEFDVQNPSGTWLDGDDEASVYLRPGDRTTTDVIWYVDDSAESGMYDARVSVWEESDPENLQTKIADNQKSDAFEVEGETEKYRLSADTDGNGGLEVYPPEISTTVVDREYQEGTTVELTATAGSESRFVEWSGNIGSADDEATTIEVTMDEARDITAVFEPAESTEIDAEITEFTVNSGEYEYGESVEATAVVENTGNAEHTYFVRYSAIGPDNNRHNISRTIPLASGAENSVAFEWAAQQDISAGEYDAEVSIWKKQGQETPQSRLDRTRQDEAFSLVQTGGSLKLRVQGPDGDPISDVSVSIADSQTTTTDSEGIAQFGELSRGTYDVTVSREGYATRSTTVTVEDGQQQAREITLSRPEGSIVGVNGVPDEYQPGIEISPVVTVRNTGDSEATFELTMATPSGIEAQTDPTQTVTLAPGAETTIEYRTELYGTDTDRIVQFELATANGDVVDSTGKRVEYTDTVVAVQVLDSTETPVEGAAVSVLSEPNSTQTNSDGRARLTSLVPGEHIVEITPPGITSGKQTVTINVAGGESTETTVQINRAGTISGTVVDETGDPLSDGLVTINEQSAFINEDGTFSFDIQFAAGKSYTVDVTQDGDSLYRQDISVSPGSNDVSLTVETDNDGGGGWQIIDNANKGAVLGEVGIQMGVSGSQTLEYHTGWLGLSMVPVADAPADIRDCVLAPNDDLATNGLDCGGAAASTIGSAGTVIGVLSSPSGAGVAVAGGSFALDTAEDIADAAKVTLSVARNVPNKINEWAEILISKVGSDKISKVLDEISDSSSKNTVRKAIDKNQLRKAGFSPDEAEELVDTGVSVERASSLSEAGLTSDRIAQLKRGDEVELERLDTWLTDLRNRDTDGYNDLVSRINEGNVGELAEAQVASKYDNTEAVGKDIQSTDIDVLLNDGTMIEVKRGGNLEGISEGSEKFRSIKSEYGTKIAKYRNYNSDGEVVFEFKMEIPDIVRDWLESEKGVTVRIIE